MENKHIIPVWNIYVFNMLQSQSDEHASDSLIKCSCVTNMMYSRNDEQASTLPRIECSYGTNALYSWNGRCFSADLSRFLVVGQDSHTDRTRGYLSVDRHCVERENRAGPLPKRHTRHHAARYHDRLLVSIPAHLEVLGCRPSGEQTHIGMFRACCCDTGVYVVPCNVLSCTRNCQGGLWYRTVCAWTTPMKLSNRSCLSAQIFNILECPQN